MLGIVLLLGLAVFGLRGPYFAIGTLGVAVAAREIAGTIEVIGAGAGIAMPFLPLPIETIRLFLRALLYSGSARTQLRWLFKTQFGLAANAIRDDEDKAEAMGVNPTLQTGCGNCGFLYGLHWRCVRKQVGYIEPLEVAFPVATFGIFMVAMSLLGGKGTLWGPVLGAILFHVVKEATWTYLFGLQWVVLGLILILNIVYFQQGIMGWLQAKYPERFGIAVDESTLASKEGV